MKKVLFLFLGMLFFSSFCLAQVGKQEAINLVMGSVVGSNSTNVNVYMESVLQMDFYYKMSRYDSIASPYSSYWLFFIDDMPEYSWGHDCRYVFVNSNSGIISSTRSHIPPYHYKLYLDVVSEPITFVTPPINTDTTKRTLVNYDYPSNKGKYALLFTGGEISGDSHTAFWNALCHSYCGLLENGFMKENIFVLSCDGGMANPSLDFDKDGEPDIMSDSCNLHSIEVVLDSLSTIMQEEDILYIYGAMHGDTVDNHTYLCLWDGGRLYDYQLANMLSRVHCSQYIVNIYSCFSGGMTEEIISIPNNAYKTVLASRDNQTELRHWAFIQYAGMDIYNYFINSAFRNYHPIYPDSIWNRGNLIGQLQDQSFFSVLNSSLILNKDINYDSLVNGGNGNNNHEIDEIINYTSHFDPYQFGMYGVKHYECGFDTADDLLSLRGLTGSVTRTQVVNGVFHIEDALSIFADTLISHNGSKFYLFDADLIIEDTASLIMGDTSSIIARSGDCHLIVKGSLAVGNGVTFEARDGATLEIIFENDADLVISNATFINCTLVLPERSISFDHCIFLGTPLAMDNSLAQSTSGETTATVTNCTFSPNGIDINTALYINHFDHYKVIGCTIESNDDGTFNYGIAIYNSGSNSGWKQVSGNDVSGCLQAGIQLYASSGSITMNTVFGNGYGIKLLNNCNITSLSGHCSATLESDTQFIHDNTKNEVYMTGSSIPQRFRYNAIHHNGNMPFVYHDAYISFGGGSPGRDFIDVKYNYWGSGFMPTTHLYTNLIGGVYEYKPVWVLGDCSNEWGHDARLLNEADSLNAAGAYLEAQSVYKQVVDDYTKTVSAETALKSLLQLETYLDGDFETLQDYYLSNESIASNETLSHLASSLANKCNERMENYEEAIAWYEDVLTDPNTSFNDSIFAAIDLGNLYLRMEAGGEKAVGKLGQYKPESEAAHERQTGYALSLLPKTKEATIATGRENMPISDLEASVLSNDTVMLTWDFPDGFDANPLLVSWIKTDTIENEAQYGYDSFMGTLYDEHDLRPLTGWKIESISFHKVSNWTHYVYVFEQKHGEDMRVLYSQEVSEEAPFGLNIITIEEDLYIEPFTKYWFSVRIKNEGQSGYIYPFGTAYYEPGMPGKSDLWLGGIGGEWWCYPGMHGWIKTILVNMDGEEKETVKPRENQSLTSYRVYRDGELIKEIPYSFVTYFTDTEYTKGIDLEYCVTAVYGDEESNPVCVTVNVTGIDEAAIALEITVAPNPTNGQVTVMGKNLRYAEVVNMLGQRVATARGDGDELQIDMASLPDGVYFFEIVDADGKRCVKKVMKE